MLSVLELRSAGREGHIRLGRQQLSMSSTVSVRDEKKDADEKHNGADSRGAKEKAPAGAADLRTSASEPPHFQRKDTMDTNETSPR